MDNRTNHTSSDQSTTAPRSEESERIEQLEKKVEKHNNLITRTFKLEQAVALLDERVRVANHRISDLEKEEVE